MKSAVLLASVALLARAGSISGSVIDPAGASIAGAKVVVNGSEEVKTDSSGHFVVSGVAAGLNSVEVSFPGFQWVPPPMLCL